MMVVLYNSFFMELLTSSFSFYDILDDWLYEYNMDVIDLVFYPLQLMLLNQKKFTTIFIISGFNFLNIKFDIQTADLSRLKKNWERL